MYALGMYLRAEKDAGLDGTEGRDRVFTTHSVLFTTHSVLLTILSVLFTTHSVLSARVTTPWGAKWCADDAC